VIYPNGWRKQGHRKAAIIVRIYSLSSFIHHVVLRHSAAHHHGLKNQSINQPTHTRQQEPVITQPLSVGGSDSRHVKVAALLLAGVFVANTLIQWWT
jgi:hypothetical protein